MFVWVFHRVSGLLLIALLGIKFFTSFFLMTKDQKPDWALVLHTNPLTDTLLIVAGRLPRPLRPEDDHHRLGGSQGEAAVLDFHYPRNGP